MALRGLHLNCCIDTPCVGDDKLNCVVATYNIVEMYVMYLLKAAHYPESRVVLHPELLHACHLECGTASVATCALDVLQPLFWSLH